MVKSRKINVGITIGDPNGIGIEIILKSLTDFSLFHECNFIIYASTDLIEKQQKHFQIDQKVYLMNQQESRNYLYLQQT